MAETKVTAGLTLDEEVQIIGLLGKVKQPWSRRFYNALSPHVALTAVETVFLKSFDEINHVLLHRRPENDIPTWRNRPASPGSMLRESDRSFTEAMFRVRGELKDALFAFSIDPVASIVQRTDRGTEISAVFVCELEGEPPEGFWYCRADALPDDILDHHPLIIKAAINNEGVARSTFDDGP